MMRRNTVRAAMLGLCSLFVISTCGGCSVGELLRTVAPTLLTSVVTGVFSNGG